MSDEPAHDFPRSIGRPAAGAFVHAGYRSIDDLAGRSRKELAALHGVGPKALRIIQELLEADGRSLAD